MAEKLNELALGYAGAIISAACMLLLGIGSSMGFYAGAARQMMQWHMFFSLTPFGILTGMVETAVIGFVALYALAWLYNKFA